MESERKHEIPEDILDSYLEIMTKNGCSDYSVVRSISQYLSSGDASGMLEMLLANQPEQPGPIDDSGQIYILKWGSVYKIGRSKDAEKRFNQIKEDYKRIQPIMPYAIELIHIIETDNMYESEKIMHKNFENRRINGEWFELSELEINEILNI